MSSNYLQLHKEKYKPFEITVDTTIEGSSGVGKFQLPFTNNKEYRCIVDWGDGTSDTITAYNQAETLHDYIATDDNLNSPYTIKITGRCDHFTFANGGDKLKLKTIESWGNIVWKTFANAFQGCSNMVANFTDTPILEKATALNSMFDNCFLFNANLNNWDTSKVVNMGAVFNGCTIFNNGAASGVAGILTWDTSSCTDLNNFFRNCSAVNLNVGGFDVSNVTTFSDFARDATLFNNGGSNTINNWTLKNSGTISMSRMFFRSSINQPLGNWNTTYVTDMRDMFYSTPFDQNIGTWIVYNCTIFEDNFKGVLGTPLSTANLDAIYGNGTTTGWAFNGGAAGVLSANEIIRFGGSTYTIATSQAGRDVLTNAPNNWVVTDGGGI